MTLRRDSGSSPLPVDPADVPADAVRFLKRTAMHRGWAMDDYLARVLVAGLIEVLREPAEVSVPPGELG